MWTGLSNSYEGGTPAKGETKNHKVKDHRLGGLHVNYVIWFFSPILIFACLYSYHMSVKQKQEKPFPHATITATACHYPQDIVFRVLMLSGGPFITLIYFILFKWMKLKKQESSFPYSTQSWLSSLAHSSVLGFYFAIATIDGAGTTGIHGPGAVFFFIVLFILLLVMTFILREMRSWDSSSIKSNSMKVKNALVGYLLGVLAYCVYLALTRKEQPNEDDPILVIIEWNLTITGLVWLLSFVIDWKDIFLTLRGDHASTIRMMEIDE